VNFLATSNATVALFTQSSNYFLVLQFPEDAVSIDEEFFISSQYCSNHRYLPEEFEVILQLIHRKMCGCSSI
jgi:hypothetical protein